MRFFSCELPSVSQMRQATSLVFYYFSSTQSLARDGVKHGNEKPSKELADRIDENGIIKVEFSLSEERFPATLHH